jgi:hypothetical protein
MRSPRLKNLFLLFALMIPACSRPTAVDRENRRVLDEILTAITIKNARLLEESAKRAAARHAEGHLTNDDYQALAALIDKGRQGDWQAAEADTYAFRKRRPFVRPGQ